MTLAIPRQQRPGHPAATVQGHITFDTRPDAVDVHLAPTSVLRRLIEAARSDPYVRGLLAAAVLGEPGEREAALARLPHQPAVAAALTLRLDILQAEVLASDLTTAWETP